MERVEVYFNLHKKVWSIRSCKTGRVIRHAPFCQIANPTFVVRPAGREKVRKEKRKNVHAFVRGYLVPPSVLVLRTGTTIPVTYNPYKNDTFINRDTGEVVTEGKMAMLTTTREVRVLI
jgi:hypothetical protein